MIRRYTSIRRKKPLIKRTVKHQKKIDELKLLADRYLADHPMCECGRTDCFRPSDVVHHTEGRGNNLLKVETFKALSGICHDWAHNNIEEAKQYGLFK